jgi:cytoskeletal protein CcmA (bactofilin family)
MNADELTDDWTDVEALRPTSSAVADHSGTGNGVADTAEAAPPRAYGAHEPPTGSNAARPSTPTVVAVGDHVTGTLQTAGGVKVAGTFEGRLEVGSYVHILPGAVVAADIVADEVVIGGRYSGEMICRNHVDIYDTAEVGGTIETPQMLLRQGASLDATVRTPSESSGVAIATKGASHLNGSSARGG